MLNALPNGGPIFIPFEQKMSFLFYLFCQRIWNLCICSGLRGKRREVLCVIQRLPSFAFNNLQIHRNAVAVSFFVKMRLFVREKKRLRSKKIREKKRNFFFYRNRSARFYKRQTFFCESTSLQNLEDRVVLFLIKNHLKTRWF